MGKTVASYVRSPCPSGPHEGPEAKNGLDLLEHDRTSGSGGQKIQATQRQAMIDGFKSGKPRYGMNRVLFFWRASPRNCFGQVLTSRWVWSRARTYLDHS